MLPIHSIMSLPIDIDQSSEEMYEVEKILEKRIDKKGTAMYRVKWEGFTEDQATWEPEDHLEGVKWLVDEFNGVKTTGKKRKLPSDASDFPKKKVEKAQKTPKSEKEPETSDSEPAVSIPPELIQETPVRSRGPPRVKGKKHEPQQKLSFAGGKATTPGAPPATGYAVYGIKAARGNLTLDVAVKILGCRRQGTAIEYAVQFKRRVDSGVVVLPQICTHEELKVQAPWLLSQYLLDCAKIEDSN